jgi:hypothetical protein
MPTPKLFVRQYRTRDGKTYMFHRYWDNHNNNYEYQVYELKVAKNAARTLGAPEVGNSRQMCDWVWENVDEFDGTYQQQNP